MVVSKKLERESVSRRMRSTQQQQILSKELVSRIKKVNECGN